MSKAAKSRARCVICGSRDHVEQNHAGGRNHVAWFTMPLCRPHHVRFHELLRIAGVDLEHTPNRRIRLIRALKATLVLAWMLLEALLEEVSHVRTS